MKLISFDECLKGGLCLDLTVAVDLTSSNHDARLPISKHYVCENRSNAYQTTMRAFIDTFLELTESKTVRLLGFGAKPRFANLNSDNTSFVFPLTGDPRPNKDEVEGEQGVLETYRLALQNVEFAGPTHFSPLLRDAVRKCDQRNQEHTDGYSVLLAITDGMFLDVQETIDLLVEASFKPFSLILVGLGEDHGEFEGFYHLASMECRDSKGKRPARNLCRFVHFE